MQDIQIALSSKVLKSMEAQTYSLRLFVETLDCTDPSNSQTSVEFPDFRLSASSVRLKSRVPVYNQNDTKHDRRDYPYGGGGGSGQT